MIAVMKRMLKTVFLAITLLLISVAPTAGLARADSPSPSASDAVIAYCFKVVSSKIRNQVCTTDTSTQARNVASWHCEGKSVNDNSAANCVESKAESYIATAAKGATTKAKFDSNLKAVFKKVGGNPNKGDPLLDVAKSPETVSCSPTDGLCSDCQNGGNGDNASGKSGGCVVCDNGTCQDPAANPQANCGVNACDLVQKYVNPTINLLSVLVGLLAIASIIIGGIQYTMSEGDPQKAGRAKNRITSTIVALVIYFFLYAGLQFVVPGGVFRH